MRKWLIFEILLLLVGIDSHSQPSCTIKEYTILDGYSHGRVYQMLQDEHGIIWLATPDGLSKFEGYSFKNFKSYPGDGISMGSSNIGSIWQNSQGNIWCLNQDGMAYLFDTRKERFIDPLKEAGFDNSEGKVSDIVNLNKGITWLVFENGVCYRIPDNTLNYSESIKRYQFKGTIVHKIIQDVECDEWILTNKGVNIVGKKQINDTTRFLNMLEINKSIWFIDGHDRFGKYNKHTGKVDLVPFPKGINDASFMRIFGQDTLAICTMNHGLLLFDCKRQSFKQINVNTAQNNSNEVSDFFKDSRGDIWIWNHNPGMYYYQNRTENIFHLMSPTEGAPKHSAPNKLFVKEDANGTIWMVPRSGNLCYFDPFGQKLKYYYQNTEDKKTIISPAVRYFFVDRQRNFWIDNNQTLVKLSFFENNMKMITGLDDQQEVRSLLFDSYNNLWVGMKNNRLKILDQQNQCLGYLSVDGKLHSYPVSFNSNVYCMLEDQKGNIWAGTRTNGILLFSRKLEDSLSFNVSHFVSDPNDVFSISNNSIYCLFQDSRNRIWIGTFDGGINLIDEDKKGKIRFINMNNYWKDNPIGKQTRVRNINEFNNEVMLFGTTNGLITCSSDFENPESIYCYRSSRRPHDKTSLINNEVFYIYCNRAGQIFVLTRNGGINQIVSKNLLVDELKFNSFTERDALLSDQTLSMIEDKKGGIWVVANQLLSRYYPGQQKVEHMNGFVVRNKVHFSEAVPVIKEKGMLLFGTNKGFLEFDPPELIEKSYLHNIVFTDIEIQGEPGKIAAPYVEQLVMTPLQRNISVSFAAIDLRDPMLIQYGYKMEGVDSDWHYSGNNRTANYLNLAPGKYRFLVKSTNSEGVWMNNEKMLSIVVKPRFHETFWAWITYMAVALFIILIVIFVLYTFYRLRYEVKMEKQLSDMKLNFFTEVSHELRTPLTLITAPVNEILEKDNVPADIHKHMAIVKRNTDRMLQMVNQILDFRKLQFQKMKILVEETEIVAFTKRIIENFYLLAKEKRIAFVFEPELEELYIWVDHDKFEKILFNLLSNAFKYTPIGKSIAITLSTNKSSAILSIKDQGIGIKPNKFELLFQRFETILNKEAQNISTGIGLSLVKEFVTLHHGEIHVKSEPDEGTEFTLLFPLGNEHLLKDSKVEIILGNNNHKINETEPDGESVLDEENQIDDEKWSILIVEDNDELRSFLSNILTRDYMVIEAVNGADGLLKAKTHVPDIIVSDVMMPEMDGLEMVHKIKENHELCHIPIILLTAKSSVEYQLAGIESGIDDYITKPFSANYLRVRMRKLLEQRRLLQQYYLSAFSKEVQGARNKELIPSEPKIASYDEQFIQRLMEFMDKNIDNLDLTIDDFISHFSMSRAVFFRKMKMLLGVSPVVFIREIRIKRAIQLIDSGITSVADVAYRCGFKAPNYFAKCFKHQMGITPSEYIDKIR